MRSPAIAARGARLFFALACLAGGVGCRTLESAPPGRRVLRFDGVDAHLVAPAIPLNGLREWTAEAWVKDWRGAVLCRGLAGDPENSLWLSRGERAHAGVPHESAGFESGAGTNHEFAVGYGPPGAWSHLALVWTGEETLVFVDGRRAVAARTPAPGPFVEDRPLYVGAHHYKTLSYGSGLLGPLRLSSIARYRSDFRPSAAWEDDPHTLLLLSPEPGEGSTVRDASSHGRHALIRGAEWIFVTDAPGP